MCALSCAGTLPLAGCTENPDFATSAFNDNLASLPTSSRLVADAKQKFDGGYYGSAVEGFSRTIEKDPLNADAWLGLAAAYDQVSRFDQADKAYSRVQELVGPTPSVLNNLGYSYLLRGNLDQSRRTLEAAYRKDPSNPYIQNNIDILNRRLVSLGQQPLVGN